MRTLAACAGLVLLGYSLMLQLKRSAPEIVVPFVDARRSKLGFDDIFQGFSRWQLWWLFALNDIRQRYRRSRLGQFWITFSMAIFIGALAFVYSTLFKTEIRYYLPFLTVNMIVWNLISGIVNDGCSAFIQAENYLKQEPLPKTIFVLQILTRNVLTFLHNIVLVPIVFVLLGASVSWLVLLALPGMLVILVNGYLITLPLAMLCARFRDLPQIVSNVVQIAFFLSPILWNRNQIGASAAPIIDFNPFANHLLIVSEPLLGNVPSLNAYLMCASSTVILASVSLPFFIRFRDRIVYWL
jgi:ABC-type polysaccharide/polyol phosphate export permease